MTFSQLCNSPQSYGRHFFSLGDWKYVPCLQANLPNTVVEIFWALRYSLKRALPLNKRPLRNRDFLDEHVPSTKPLRHSIIFVFDIFYVIIAAVIVIKKGC